MAEPIGTESGTIWLSVPEAARHLGISERAVRKRIAANALPAEREGGGPWRVQVSTADAAPRAVPGAVPGAAPGGPTSGTGVEPIEAAYRVAGEAAEVALVPLATMVEELHGLADQLQEMSRRNETLALEVGTLRERQVGQEGQIAARDQTISTQAEVIAELRRRAEVAEVELSLRNEKEAERDRLAAAQAAQEAPSAQEQPEGAQGHAPGVWGRVRRWWRG